MMFVSSEMIIYRRKLLSSVLILSNLNLVMSLFFEEEPQITKIRIHVFHPPPIYKAPKIVKHVHFKVHTPKPHPAIPQEALHHIEDHLSHENPPWFSNVLGISQQSSGGLPHDEEIPEIYHDSHHEKHHKHVSHNKYPQFSENDFPPSSFSDGENYGMQFPQYGDNIPPEGTIDGYSPDSFPSHHEEFNPHEFPSNGHNQYNLESPPYEHRYPWR